VRDGGLRIPEDIALVSFDDLPAAIVTFPFLTVVAQPAYEMGQKATELLIARLTGETPIHGVRSATPGDCQEFIMPTELIIRQSSGTVRH
jgi:DNA-binding LacI/PurR family transcriptional regulator